MSMNGVFICGDTHQSHDIDKLKRFNTLYGPDLTKDDYVIVCGDFGLLWNNPFLTKMCDYETKAIESCPEDNNWNEKELDLLNWYESLPWTTLFVDG